MVHNPARAEVPSPGRGPALLADGSPDGDARRGVGGGGGGGGGPGVKKHHHKHNLKHRYELLETLGRGTYGKVKKAIERQSGREVSRVETPQPSSTAPVNSPTCVCVCALDWTKQHFLIPCTLVKGVTGVRVSWP